MNNSKTVVLDSEIRRFVDLLRDGFERIKEAAKLYVELLDADETIKDRIIKEDPTLNEKILAPIERLGRKQLHLRLYWNAGSYPHDCLSKLPYSQQEKYLKEPFELYQTNGEVLNVKLETMSKEAAKQIFNKDHVRTVAEQRSYLASIKNLERVRSSMPYVIKKGMLIIKEPCSIDKKQLLNIIGDMK